MPPFFYTPTPGGREGREALPHVATLGNVGGGGDRGGGGGQGGGGNRGNSGGEGGGGDCDGAEGGHHTSTREDKP